MSRNEAARAAATAAAYFLLAGLGLAAFGYGTVPPFWPASGLAMAALALWGIRLWPVILAAAFLADLLWAGGPVALSAALGMVSSAEAVLGARLLRRWRIRGELATMRSALIVTGVAVAAAAFSALLGVPALAVGGRLADGAMGAAALWWISHSMGALVVTPLVLAWLGRRAAAPRVPRPVEFAGAILLEVGALAAVFLSGVHQQVGLVLPPVGALLFPSVLWAIFRLRPRQAMAVLAAGYGAAVAFLALQAGSGTAAPMAVMQVMLLPLSAGCLVIVAALTERALAQAALKESRARLSEALGSLSEAAQRKLTELALQASEAKLNSIAEHAPIGIAYMSLPERRFLWVNERLCRITGYARDELLRMSSLDITPPEDRPIGDAEYRKMFAGECEDFTMEKRYRRKGGEIIWTRSVVAAVDNRRSQENLVVALVEDITEEKRAAAARREAERHLEIAVEIAELGSWEYDVDTGCVTVASGWRKRLGIAEGECLDRAGWLDRIHPEDRARVAAYFADYLERPAERYGVEYRFRFGDGAYRWFSSRAMPIRDEAGRLIKLVGSQLDITERKQAEERIRRESMHDALTGLPNRSLIFDRGRQFIEAARRQQGRCAVLFIDLDRFKPINDTYGHEAGDAVLVEVARRLRACTRRADMVGRFGGDEFIVLLPHPVTEYQRVHRVAQHVLEAVARPIALNGASVSVSPSIGVSYFPEQGQDLEALIQKADMAMYRAKQDGRANYQTYTPELERRADEALAHPDMLRAAMDEGRLLLHYQPILSMHTGRPVGAEALIRMVEDDGRIVGPRSFLPKSESAALGLELDNWVLTAACRQHRAWAQQGLTPMLLSVNLSSQQLFQPDFAEGIQRIVAASGIDPGQLQLEISGTVLDSPNAIASLQFLKSIGVRIALDGFGAVPLDLGRLAQLPIDCIKVEPALVRGLPGNDSASRLIVGVGKMLNADVIGEGVESEEVLNSMRACGCDEAQGFYLSRPLAPDDFVRWCEGQQVH